MTEFQKGIISLVKSALINEKVELPGEFDWEKAVRLGKSHQILPLLYYGAYNSGINIPQQQKEKIESETYNLMYYGLNQLHTLSGLIAQFENNGIDYMPFKGTLLKQMYPKAEMRPMGDADILIRPEQVEKISSIMSDSGYVFVKESDHEIAWAKESKLYVELHKRMISSENSDFYKYYGETWHFAEQSKEHPSRYEMRAEEHFVYIVVHFAKHYRNGGIGIRHLTDIFVFLQKSPNLDQEHINSSLEKLHLLEFYNNLHKTIDVWFNNRQSDELTDFITTVIFGSGSFGTAQDMQISNALKATQKGEDSNKYKKRMLTTAVFLPYKNMCIKYPVLRKCPFLLPILWVVRGLNILFFKRENIKRQNETFKNLNDDNLENYRRSLEFVGLDLNFKE